MRIHFSILLLTIIFLLHEASAQTGSIGIGTSTPDTSSILDVSAVKKGVLLPRMTKAQRDSIKAPATGLIIYQTDLTPGFYYYNAGWKALTTATSNFANRSLSNLLAPVAINADLLPGVGAPKNLGAAGSAWQDLHLDWESFYVTSV